MEYGHVGPDVDTTRPDCIQAQREQHAKHALGSLQALGAVHARGQELDGVKQHHRGRRLSRCGAGGNALSRTGLFSARHPRWGCEPGDGRRGYTTRFQPCP